MALVQDVIREIATEFVARSERAVYRHLVESLVNGAEVSGTHTAKLLKEIGKTPEELQTDVECFTSRREWRAQPDGDADVDRATEGLGETDCG